MKKNLFILLIILFCTSISCKKNTDKPSQLCKTNNPLSTAIDKRINKILEPYAKESSTASVSVGYYKDNTTSFYGYGETKKGNNIIPDSTTIYEIGSISKTFTALLMIDYLQSQSLSIDCVANNLLPNDVPLLQYNNEPVMVKHLLNHTSGLPRLPEDFGTGIDPDNPYKHYDSTMVYNYLKSHPISKDPGYTWEYSNLGMAIVGLILERQSKKSYEQLLIDKICIPMRLNDTRITLNKADSLNIATGYDQDGNQVPYWDDLNAFKSTGAIRSNARDLINYGKSILYSENSVIKSQIDSCLKVTYDNNNKKQASGWVCQSYDGIDYIIHDGGTAGFNSYILICKEKKSVLVLLFSNGPSDSRDEYVRSLIIEACK